MNISEPDVYRGASNPKRLSNMFSKNALLRLRPLDIAGVLYSITWTKYNQNDNDEEMRFRVFYKLCKKRIIF